ATYQWINCANNQVISGATSQSYSATANGEYAVIVTQNGCSDTSACTTISTIGISELSASFNLFPNPANDLLTIEGTELMENVAILDISGKVLFSSTNASVIHNLNIESLSRGMYLVRFIANNETYTKQFVKQ
ncbi:MAG: T9SS C-terminal target domain-containing protein, partial [Crocinitomicaceae bacterium]|nr:T9SS C-terminal target domain-containing protein [Crocinitomicaceae bacterium]